MTGLEEKEQEVMDHLVEAMAGYAKLPRQHPTEMDEFIISLHRLQELLAIRIVRRQYPEGWYAKHYPASGA
ncbi:MAG: hypothetical protein IH921_05780 [Gemmatimonadetes bacterium]|nr:hypothetical protein [Gemmatimonadota bacterium]